MKKRRIVKGNESFTIKSKREYWYKNNVLNMCLLMNFFLKICMHIIRSKSFIRFFFFSTGSFIFRANGESLYCYHFIFHSDYILLTFQLFLLISDPKNIHVSVLNQLFIHFSTVLFRRHIALKTNKCVSC